MPSEKVLKQKQETVVSLKEEISGAAAGVVVDYKGISVANDTKLRTELREAGVTYKVVKNSLLRFAFGGTELEGMNEVLKGTTAIAFSGEDPIAPARVLGKYAEGSKGAFSIKNGFMDGRIMSAEEVIALGKLPGREQLLAMLCSVLQAPVRGLAVALNAVAEKDAEGVAVTTEAVAEEVETAPEAVEVTKEPEAVEEGPTVEVEEVVTEEAEISAEEPAEEPSAEE